VRRTILLPSASLLLSLALALTACASPEASTATPSAASSPSARPSSSAIVTITSPKNGEAVTGTKVKVTVSLENARIVSATTTNIRPDQGHLHLYVNNVLTSMNYQLDQELTVHAGTYAVKVEFVAADHAPFNPRVISPVVVFTVK
jgi:uncharacterized lipoprotein YmbA